MENRENPASSTDVFSGDVGSSLLRRLALAGVLFVTPGCRDEVVFAELSATRAKLEACQAENTNLKVQLARNEGGGDDDDDDEIPVFPSGLPVKKVPTTPVFKLPTAVIPVGEVKKVDQKKINTPDAGSDEVPRFEIIERKN